MLDLLDVGNQADEQVFAVENRSAFLVDLTVHIEDSGIKFIEVLRAQLDQGNR